MKKGTIALIVFAAFALFGGVWACSTRNGFVKKREAARSQWQQVESQYQRRSDLVPNLVATVKGQANYEQKTLEAVVLARARATQVNIDPSKLDQASIEKYKAAQGELGAALGRLLMVSENYPELKANQAFGELRTAIEGCENRIATERMRYNDLVKIYKQSLMLFPGNLLAGGFEPMPYFEAEAGTEKAPKVEF